MLKHFLTVLVFVSMVQPCPEPANYNYATLEEEISLAGAIARGRVVDVIGDVNNASVRLADVVFYRGRGQVLLLLKASKMMFSAAPACLLLALTSTSSCAGMMEPGT